MQKMSRTEFTAAMSRLRACYQNGIKDKALWLASLSTYWDLLSAYEADDIRAAFAVAWRRYPDWMPSAGQLASLVEKSSSTAAAEAWLEVLRLASRSSGDHSDPIARKAISMMGGGSYLGRQSTRDLETWARKRFDELYVQLAKETDTETTKAALGAHRAPSASSLARIGTQTPGRS